MSSEPRAPGLRIGSIAGAPIRIGWSWVLLAVAVVVLYAPVLLANNPGIGGLAFVIAAGYAVIFLVSVLVHEVAHALTARALGMRVVAVVADLFGGHTSFDGTRLTARTSALVAAAGPGANLVLAGLAWLVLALTPGSGVASHLLAATAYANVALAVFNLLPGLPLDGGQLLEALVWGVSGDRRRGTTVAAWGGRAVAALVVVGFVLLPAAQGRGISSFALWSLLIAWFLWRGASQSLTRSKVLGRLEGRRVDDLVHPLPVVAADTTVDRVPEPGIAVVVEEGRPVGLVTPEGIEAVPASARRTTLVSAVYRRGPDDWVIDAREADLLPAVQVLAARRLAYALVVRDGHVLGLLRGDEVQRLLEH